MALLLFSLCALLWRPSCFCCHVMSLQVLQSFSMLPLHPKVRQLLAEGTRKQLQAAGFNPTSTATRTDAVLLQQHGVMASIIAKLARRPTATPVPLRLYRALGASYLRPNGRYFAARLLAAPRQRLSAAVSGGVEVKTEEGVGAAAGGRARRARKRRALVLDDSDEEEEGGRRPARSQRQVGRTCVLCWSGLSCW